jgi:rhodanese-related sulfurtransferase
LFSRKTKTIAPADAARAADAGELQLVDIRPEAEATEERIAHALNIPFGPLDARLGEIDAARPVAFVCRAGVRSEDAAKLATKRGFDALSVAGGATAWRESAGAAS